MSICRVFTCIRHRPFNRLTVGGVPGLGGLGLRHRPVHTRVRRLQHPPAYGAAARETAGLTMRYCRFRSQSTMISAASCQAFVPSRHA